MIEAAQQALEDKEFDGYSVAISGPNYVVTLTKGSKTAEGVGPTEEAAYKAAKKDF